MAEFSDIVLNTTAERLETVANMDINSDVIDENSNDGSLPTSKAVYEAITQTVGDISAALDELHAYAQALVTGGSAE